MKKLTVAVVAISMILAAVAYGQVAQENTYAMSATTAPTNAGTAAKPVGISLNFNYTVGEKSNNRPSPIKTYDIGFDGVVVTQTGLPVCSADTLNAAQTDANCPKGSKVGAGVVKNIVGPTNDPTSKAAQCQLALTIYNSIPHHASLWLLGTCAGAAVHNAIDAIYKKKGTLSVLSFTVPAPLLHPITGLDNAVTYVQSKINNVRVGKGKKKTSYYASRGGCKKHKRKVQVVFVTEAGQSTTAKAFAKCK